MNDFSRRSLPIPNDWDRRGLPAWTYHSPALFNLERDYVFLTHWQVVGHENDIPAPGDWLSFDLLGERAVVMRGHDGVVRAFHNLCRHRGARVVDGEEGHCKGAIVCPFHGWVYNLDGTLRGAPAMTLNEGFCRDQIALPKVRCEVWLGWIMVTLNPDAPSPAERLKGVEALVGKFHMENYREDFRETFRWATNWKVLAENFMESYHLPMCHEGTIGGHVDLTKMTCPEGQPAFNYHFILKNDALDLTLAHPTNTVLEGDERRTTWLLAIYPSLLITLTPGYFWYLSLTPDGPGHVNVLYGGGLAPEFVTDPKSREHFDRLKTLLDEVNDEDKGCTERVYQGICAGLSEPGPLSHLERPNFEFARYIASRIPA
jgi:phenylpropionate dioxygenase-like ring-hydroxylating dioxygenase large terminal subunit